MIFRLLIAKCQMGYQKEILYFESLQIRITEVGICGQIFPESRILFDLILLQLLSDDFI